MKSKFALYCTGLLLFTGAAPTYSESAEAIVNRFEEQKVEALEAYMKAQPEADDTLQAIEALLQAHGTLGNDTRVLDLVVRQYKLKVAAGNVDLGELFVETIQPTVELCWSLSEADRGRAFIEGVRKDFAEHPMAQQVNQALSGLEQSLNRPQMGGEMKMEFTPLSGGDKMSLSGLKGKYVLVDFWATWCGPCVSELPHLKEAYTKFKEKGFEIVAISADHQRAALDDFLKQNPVSWIQCYDADPGHGFGAQFGITQLPTNFLLDPEGKIVAMDLRGDALLDELAQRLSE